MNWLQFTCKKINGMVILISLFLLSVDLGLRHPQVPVNVYVQEKDVLRVDSGFASA